MGKKTIDIDAFNSKTSGNGFVNDATEAPLNLIKFLRGNKKKKDALQQAKDEAGGY